MVFLKVNALQDCPAAAVVLACCLTSKFDGCLSACFRAC
jgi:hypothetical protein